MMRASRVCALLGSHGFPWVPMGSHGVPWGPHGVPMGPHGFPWVPMGPHGSPWFPMGSHGVPWGPMGSPWLPWKIQECRNSYENHYSVRQKIGEPGSKSIRNMFPLHPVTSKPPESPYGAKKNAGNPLFQFFGLLDPYWLHWLGCPCVLMAHHGCSLCIMRTHGAS